MIKKWTQEEEVFLQENYRKNGPKFCALALRRTTKSIKHRASQLKIKYLNKGKHRKKTNNKIDNDIIHKYQNGMRTKEIAKEYNISQTLVIKILNIYNIEITTNRRKTKEEWERIDALKNRIFEDYLINKLQPNEIYKKYNISKRIFRKLREQENIPIQPQKILKGKETGMYGKSLYSVWLEKYGKVEADKRMEEYKKKQSIRTGKNNPMYGKTCSRKCGAGWNGYYKDFYFRSLRELSYILFLDENNIPWESAENNKYAIKYKDLDETDRTYRPDFLVNGNTLVEIKPERLQNTPLVKLKTQAAIKFCEENNLIFQITDSKIESNKIKNALDAGFVKFSKDYERKFLENISK